MIPSTTTLSIGLNPARRRLDTPFCATDSGGIVAADDDAGSTGGDLA
jgi:hypothetical protein